MLYLPHLSVFDGGVYICAFVCWRLSDVSACCCKVQKCDLSHSSPLDMRSVVTRHQRTQLFFFFWRDKAFETTSPVCRGHLISDRMHYSWFNGSWARFYPHWRALAVSKQSYYWKLYKTNDWCWAFICLGKKEIEWDRDKHRPAQNWALSATILTCWQNIKAQVIRCCMYQSKSINFLLTLCSWSQSSLKSICIYIYIPHSREFHLFPAFPAEETEHSHQSLQSKVIVVFFFWGIYKITFLIISSSNKGKIDSIFI